MDVEHEVDETALDPRPQARQQRKAGAGDFRCPFEIQNAQWRAEIPVGFVLKVELRRLTDPPDLDVLFFAGTHGDGRIGQVRDDGCELEQLRFDGPERILFFFDLLGYDLHFVAFRGDVDLFPDQFGDLLGGGVPLLPQLFDIINDAFALTVQPLERLYIKQKSPVGQPLSGCFDVFSQIIEVEHGKSPGKTSEPHCRAPQGVPKSV